LAALGGDRLGHGSGAHGEAQRLHPIHLDHITLHNTHGSGTHGEAQRLQPIPLDHITLHNTHGSGTHGEAQRPHPLHTLWPH
jgi:hypothetical protein